MLRTLPLLLAVLSVSISCSYPSQLVWAPGGATAAYRNGDSAYVVDKDGTVLTKLGKSPGAIAWSRDGKRLYYGSEFLDGEKAVKESRELFQGPVPPVDGKKSKDITAIRIFENGKSRELCRLNGSVIHAVLSPDETWLAAVVMFSPEPLKEGEKQDTWLNLCAVSLRDGKVYLLGHPASFGIAFTGSDRLAYVERDAVEWKQTPLSSKLVEVSLNDAAKHGPRKKPFTNEDVVFWIRGEGEHLWLMGISADAARKAEADDESVWDLPVTLRKFSRATGKVDKIAENLATMLAISPDGRRLVTIRAEGEGEAKTQKLVVMNTDGTNIQPLRTTDPKSIPLFPSWRDDDHLILSSAQMVREIDGGRRELFAVEEYGVGNDNTVKWIRTLSRNWPDAMLPFKQTSFGDLKPWKTDPSVSMR